MLGNNEAPPEALTTQPNVFVLKKKSAAFQNSTTGIINDAKNRFFFVK